jgi:hypothetical protein
MPANPQKTTAERPWKDPKATPQLVIENLSKSYGRRRQSQDLQG